MRNIFAKKESECKKVEVNGMEEFAQEMRLKMISEHLSYSELAQINLNSVINPVKDEITTLEKEIEVIKEKAINTLRAYPHMKRRQEIIEHKKRKISLLEVEYGIGPQLKGLASKLDNLNDQNKAAVLLLQVREEIVPVYNKLIQALKHLEESDSFLFLGCTEPNTCASEIIRSNNGYQSAYREHWSSGNLELEKQFFQELKKENDIFTEKADIEKAFIGFEEEALSKTISPRDVVAYEEEWKEIDAILFRQQHTQYVR